MAMWRPTLIPRKQLDARRVDIVYDAYNRPSEVEVVFTIENAGVQPVSGNELKVLPEGLRDKISYRIITTTEVRGLKEGTDDAGDKVMLYGDWFRIVRVEIWDTGVQSHYNAIAVKED